MPNCSLCSLFVCSQLVVDATFKCLAPHAISVSGHNRFGNTLFHQLFCYDERCVFHRVIVICLYTTSNSTGAACCTQYDGIFIRWRLEPICWWQRWHWIAVSSVLLSSWVQAQWLGSRIWTGSTNEACCRRRSCGTDGAAQLERQLRATSNLTGCITT
jgi:hypothetical protein